LTIFAASYGLTMLFSVLLGIQLFTVGWGLFAVDIDGSGVGGLF
jgi:hypothetical protein